MATQTPSIEAEASPYPSPAKRAQADSCHYNVPQHQPNIARALVGVFVVCWDCSVDFEDSFSTNKKPSCVPPATSGPEVLPLLGWLNQFANQSNRRSAGFTVLFIAIPLLTYDTQVQQHPQP
jgi:hypothetical protein